MALFKFFFLTRLLGTNFFFLKKKIGAVDVKLTEEEKKELEAPYIAQAAFGHS